MTDNPHYVTPEEASAKTCHVISTPLHGVVCLGPKCMAWRWVSLGHFINDQSKKVEHRLSTTHGFCGVVRHD